MMVIRNAMLRMNGCEVGNWDAKVNPACLRMELINAFENALRNNSLQPKKAVRRSKRKLADDQE